MLPSQLNKLRWGELDDEEDDYDYHPPPVVVGPDENGIKKEIVYMMKDGQKVKVTTTSRTRKLAHARLSKRAIERRSWPKFGHAANADAGSRLTMVSTEEILLERPKAPGAPTEESTMPGDLSMLSKRAGAVLMVCRTCGKKGDHWTSKCPYKDLAAQSESFVDTTMLHTTHLFWLRLPRTHKKVLFGASSPK